MCVVLKPITSNQSGKSDIGWDHSVLPLCVGVIFPNHTIVRQYPQGRLPALFRHFTPGSYQ